QELNGAHLVVEMDPRVPLVSAADWPADEELEGQQLLRQRAPFGAQDDSSANDGAPDAKLAGGRRRDFPVEADLGEKVVAGREGFRYLCVARLRAIVADGAGLNQHARLV